MTLNELAHLFRRKIRELYDPDLKEWIVFISDVQILSPYGRPLENQHGNGPTRLKARQRYAARLRGKTLSVDRANHSVPRTLVA